MTEMLMHKGVSTRVGQPGLFVLNEISAEDLAALPGEKELIVTARTSRNPKQLALAWVLAKIVADACSWLPDKEAAMSWMKLKARHVRMIQDPRTGKVEYIPMSIAFASLDQTSFNRVFNRFIWVVVNLIIPSMDEGKLRKELERIAGGSNDGMEQRAKEAPQGS